MRCMVPIEEKLSRIVISPKYEIVLPDYGNQIIELSPLPKAVFLLFLKHPEGLYFKDLVDYKVELRGIYEKITNRTSSMVIGDSIDKVTDPTQNAINEKCSRIKKVFLELMDEYTASYYFISSHTQKHIAGSSRIWYERLKVITLPRELVKCSFLFV